MLASAENVREGLRVVNSNRERLASAGYALDEQQAIARLASNADGSAWVLDNQQCY